jgi:enamine deaminase RidA (YjgF/YER057c/UK114 family)
MKTVRRLHVGKRLSEVAVFNGVAYLAGQVPERLDVGIVEQTTEVLGMVDRLLAEVGSSKAQLLMVQIFLADLADYEGMNAAWDAWVAPGHAPPRATVQAQLANPLWRVEVVVTAACEG